MTANLPSLDGSALLLDFDGVLVDFAPAPDLVRPEPYLVDTLRALVDRLDGAVGIVTGRPLADIDRFLSPLELPATGQHGREVRLPGQAAEEAMPPDLTAEEAAVRDFVAAHAGTAAERKSAAVGIHYRQAPEHEAAARTLMERLAEARGDLALMSGKMIFELKEAGVHKGQGVETLMAVAPFAGRTPVFVGDDVTDEDGFRAAQGLGGQGVKVGEGETIAGHRAPDLWAVHDWLRDAARVPAA